MRDFLEQAQTELLCLRVVRIDARPYDHRTGMIGRDKTRRDALFKRAHHERWPPYLQDEAVLSRREYFGIPRTHVLRCPGRKASSAWVGLRAYEKYALAAGVFIRIGFGQRNSFS